MSKECILSILFKGLSKAKPPLEILRFDIRYSSVRCFVRIDYRNGELELESLFHGVSYE
jgi:hypothetical protein